MDSHIILPGLRAAAVVVGTGLAALALTACTGSPAPASGTSGGESQGRQDVVVTATDLKLDPPTFSVIAGRPVQLTFTNKGVIEHDWSPVGLEAKDVQIVAMPSVLSSQMAEHAKELVAGGIPYAGAGAGQHMVVSFTPADAGSFDVICQVPGHKEAGMVAKIVVTDPTRANAS